MSLGIENDIIWNTLLTNIAIRDVIFQMKLTLNYLNYKTLYMGYNMRGGWVGTLDSFTHCDNC
jgi:hypothetical protein